MVKSYDIKLVYSVAVSVSSLKIDKSKVYVKETDFLCCFRNTRQQVRYHHCAGLFCADVLHVQNNSTVEKFWATWAVLKL